jgi:1-acyl-sn-glycerol-3-phosphate acyltransferase
MLFLRSLIFWMGMMMVTLAYFCMMAVLIFFPLYWRRKIIMTWADVIATWLRWCCGITYSVIGKEHIPNFPCIITSNHESAWETIVFQLIFPRHLWVIKRELLWIPLFGWTLHAVKPIAIDRGDRARSMQQILEQGRICFDQGLWLLIFPQGTRLHPDDPTPYKLGAARMSLGFDIPLLPVSVNAWKVWPKNSFIKKPGHVTVVIGPPIYPKGREPEEITLETETWIRGHRPD